MKITIKTDSDLNETEEMIFTNDGLNNYNFIEILIGGKEYMISYDDLKGVVQGFRVYKEMTNDFEIRERLGKGDEDLRYCKDCGFVEPIKKMNELICPKCRIVL